jgi:hypothetical protein
MIENVNRDDIEICEILFSSDRNGGGPISDKKFLQNNILIIFFENSKTAKNLLNQNRCVEYAGNTYIPKKVSIKQKEMLEKGFF